MATKEKSEVALTEVAGLPAGLDLSDIEADSGVGVDNMGMDDVAVPYLYVLQTNSPQVNSDHDAYVEGAKAGMFYNNVSGEVFDGREIGLTVIPCAYERKFVEWVDRDSGGGFVAEHDVESNVLSETTPDSRGRPILGNGHLIVETAYHYVYMQNPKTQVWEEIIIPMKSTFLKKSRRWNKALMATLIPGTGKRAPRWLYPYKLKTAKESKGDQTWSNIEIERLEAPVTKDQYLQAKSFAELFTSGLIQRAKETLVGDPETTGTRHVDSDSGLEGDELPF